MLVDWRVELDRFEEFAGARCGENGQAIRGAIDFIRQIRLDALDVTFEAGAFG